MNRRQQEKKYKREFRKFFASKFHDLGWEIKPSRVKLMTKKRAGMIFMYGYNGHKAIELSLICKEEDENDG